jgi:hypothetical protein
MASDEEAPLREELTDEQKRANLLHFVFCDDERKYQQFCDTLRSAIPQQTQVVLRGSAVTGYRWKDGTPFDHHGPGTSDLDLTLVGDEAIHFFKLTGFYVPAVHSIPVGDKRPDIAPELVPLREKLMAIVNRPVNIQASRDIVLHFRGDLLGQPYLVLIPKPDRSTPLGLERE